MTPGTNKTIHQATVVFSGPDWLPLADFQVASRHLFTRSRADITYINSQAPNRVISPSLHSIAARHTAESRTGVAFFSSLQLIFEDRGTCSFSRRLPTTARGQRTISQHPARPCGIPRERRPPARRKQTPCSTVHFSWRPELSPLPLARWYI